VKLVKLVKLANDGMPAFIVLEVLNKGRVHEFDLAALRSWDGGKYSTAMLIIIPWTRLLKK